MIFCIYSDVTNWTLEQFRREIENEAEEVTFEICSAGGNIFYALGMIDLIRMRGIKSRCNIYGWAASAAGILALSCDNVRMTSNGSILLHSVWSPEGELDEKTRDYINTRQLTIIQRRCPSFSMDDLTAETWYDAKACAERGFSDETVNFDAIVKDNMVSHLVAMARPIYKREAKMKAEEVKAECGNEKRSEEEKEIKAEDMPSDPGKTMEDVVEKILERLEQMDHRLAVLEGEGKKEDDESNLEMVAARVNTLWARACNEPTPVSKEKIGQAEAVKKASAIAHEFWK